MTSNNQDNDVVCVDGKGNTLATADACHALGQSERALLELAGRKCQSTSGNGNCFFNAVAAQLPELPTTRRRKSRSTVVGCEMRRRVGRASRLFLPEMALIPGAWQREIGGGRRSRSRSKRRKVSSVEPHCARDYQEYIGKNGVWGTTFDAALAAHVLREKYQKRLIVLDARTCTFHLKLPPQSKLNDEYDLSNCCPSKKVTADEITPEDVVIRLRGLHFSACCVHIHQEN